MQKFHGFRPSAPRCVLVSRTIFSILWVTLVAILMTVPAAGASCSAVPSAPTGLAASNTISSGTTLSWTAVAAPSNCSITSYTVLENGTLIGTTTSTSYSVTGLSASTTYSFTVEATDSDGTSAASSAVSVTTLASTGATLYVSPSGSDTTGTGSSSAPYASITKADSEAVAGDTIVVEAGTYNAAQTISTSGTASDPIIIVGQSGAIISGSSVKCCTTPSFASGYISPGEGLINIGSSTGVVNYVTVEGLTIENFTSSSASDIVMGIAVSGGGTGLVIQNNIIENIQNSNKKGNGNAYCIALMGSSSTPLSVTVTGNTVTGCWPGESETVALNGNVQNSVVSNNTIYNNINIGVDVEGFYGVGPSGSDQPKAIDVYGNTVYQISAINNPGEQASSGGYDADALYCDGCTQVVFERNLVYANDIGIEATAETTDEVGSYVIIRNNVVYGSNSTGITVGGYADTDCGSKNADNGCGGSQDIYIVNNTLYDNNLESSAASADFQIQYNVSNIVFENNIVEEPTGWFINGAYSGSTMTANYNDYYTASSSVQFIYKGITYTSFSSYQSASGQDKNSITTNPEFDSLPTCTSNEYTPAGNWKTISKAGGCTGTANLDIPSTSPAVNTGSSALGTPSGSDWSTYETSQPYVGSYDFNGNARVNSSGEINMGAYEK